MAKLPQLNAIQLSKILKKLGFKFVRQKGSHMFFKHPDGRTTVVPNHPGETIGPGLLLKIIKQDLQITREEFERLLQIFTKNYKVNLLMLNNMGWKSWPYWLKGGVIFSGIGFVYSLLSTVFIFQIPISVSISFYVFGIFVCGLEEGQGILPLFFCTGIVRLISIVIVLLILLFLVGSFIGFIIQKIKSRKIKEQIKNA